MLQNIDYNTKNKVNENIHMVCKYTSQIVMSCCDQSAGQETLCLMIVSRTPFALTFSNHWHLVHITSTRFCAD